MIDAYAWAERWQRARGVGALRGLVRALVRELRPMHRDAAGELRLTRLAMFGAGQLAALVVPAADVHPLARVQVAVELHRQGQRERAARTLVRALRALETADDDGGGP